MKMRLQQFIECATALLSFCLLFALSQSASVSIALSNNYVQLGGSFQIAVTFSPISSTVLNGERLLSLKCGYQDGTGSFIPYAEYNTGSSSLQLVTTGFPQLYAGRLSIVSAKTIRIFNVKFDDERMKYYCILKYGSGVGWWLHRGQNKSLNSLKQSLSTVYAQPWFSKTLLPDISHVFEKETLTLNCTVTSRPVSYISWSFDKTINGLQSNKVIPYANYYVSITSSLTISNISRSLNGTTIKCIGAPRFGTTIWQPTTMVVSCTYSCETWNGGCSYVCSENNTSVQSSCSPDQALEAGVTAKSKKTDTCMIVNPCSSSERIIYQPNNANNCPCLTGYYGKSCNVHLRECSANSCGTKGKCLNDQETCGCIDGFTGRHCSIDIDECHNNTKCMNNATCIDGINSYTCQCRDGFSGKHCSIDIDECHNNTNCMNNATCIDGINSYTCQCRDGFSGKHCSIDIDECQNNTNCMNKATCIDGINSYTCRCADGFTGKHCSINIDECHNNTNCMNNATCIDGINSYTCKCTDGFTGRHCSIDIDECHNNTNCMNNATCIDDINSYTCKCTDGFTGKHCSVDIDECHNNFKCMNNALCIDGINSYTCRCADGFAGQHCSINIDDCHNNTTCMNNASCIDGINSYTCHCRGGYTGMHCEKLDPCFKNKCKNGICIGSKVSYKCQCYIGYTGEFCDADIDECKLQPKNVCNHGSCVSGNNTFHCKCLDWYIGDRCDIDQSPCRSNPCGNRGTCVIKPAVGFVCKCNDGFTGTRCEQKPKPCDVKPCMNKATCENVDEDGGLIFKCNCMKGYGGNTCQFFYGNTAVRVTLKTKKAKPFNETAFRNAIAKSMNDFCSKSPESCPQIVADKNLTNHDRFRRSPTKPYIYKSSDVKFIPGYPKTKPDGRIVIRFFVTFESSSSFPGKPGNSTATPKNLAVVNPSTVKKALDDDRDTSSYGFNIQSVEVVHTTSESKAKKSNDTSKTLAIIIAILTIAVVICTIVGAYLFWRRYQRLDPFTKSGRSESDTSKWMTNRSCNEENKAISVKDIKTAKESIGRAKKENQAKPNEYINMVALQEESGQSNEYVNIDKDVPENTIRNSQYANMDTILREKRSIPLYDNMIQDDSDIMQNDSDYLQPVVLHEDDLYLKIIN